MGLPFLDIASTAATVLDGIFKGIQGHKQQKMADAIHPVNAVYNTSQYAKNQLGAVNEAYNGRMAGAANAETNIGANQANSFAGVERNSTNSSQSLAMLSGLQGNSNNAYTDLASKEAMNHQALLGELGQANQGMVAEGDKVYNDQLRNYNNGMAAKNALQSAAWQNKGAMFSDLSNSLIGAGNAAEKMTGGAGGGAGGGGGSASGATGMSYSAPQISGGYIPPMQNSTGYINPFIKI